MQWHVIYFPVPKGRKHWIKARSKPTRANNKLRSSMPNVWDFKGLGWLCPSRFAVFETQLSRAHYIPRRKQEMMSHSSGISNICRFLFKPDFTRFFIWVLHTWTPHLYHCHTFLPQLQLLSCSFPPKLISYLIIIAIYTTQTHTHMYVWLTAHNYLCLYIHVSTHGWPLGAGQPIWSLSLKETHLFFSQRQWPPVILLQGMRSCEISCLHCMSTGDGVTLIFSGSHLVETHGCIFYVMSRRYFWTVDNLDFWFL